ncbi:MAG: hypothetical protein HY445_00300 [Candidatus Niyogibacteria bacterium]|nr:hypothetical protein [Candidatus Niyogibacteria bacterium]
MKPLSLHELVNYAWQHSNFYRELWKSKGFNPEKEFRSDSDLKKIPILTKSEFLSTSAKSRSILNPEDGYYFTAISSGATARPLISLQSRFPKPSYYRFIESQVKGSRSSVLILRPASHATAFLGATLPEKYFPPGSIFSIGDIVNYSVSAHIAKEIEADSLVARPSDAVRFAAVLEQVGYSLSRITFVWITGEPLTSAATSLLKSLYSNAVIFYVYAMTEGPCSMGMKSSLCSSLDAIGPGAYHLNTEDFIFEIPEKSSIVTALHKIPTPIIRYETGDSMTIKENFQCSCGFPVGTIGIIGPRDGESSYKIGGCLFRVGDIQKVLKFLPELVTTDFILRIEQKIINNRLENHLRFTVRPIGVPTDFVTDVIREALKKKLYVTRSRTLEDAMRQSIIGRIEIDYNVALNGSSILPPDEILTPFQDVA